LRIRCLQVVFTKSLSIGDCTNHKLYQQEPASAI
jgi:hypothetical protein